MDIQIIYFTNSFVNANKLNQMVFKETFALDLKKQTK